MEQGQLQPKTALICYGLGGAVATVGWFNIAFIYMGMGILFVLSIFLTFSEGT